MKYGGGLGDETFLFIKCLLFEAADGPNEAEYPLTPKLAALSISYPNLRAYY